MQFLALGVLLSRRHLRCLRPTGASILEAFDPGLALPATLQSMSSSSPPVRSSAPTSTFRLAAYAVCVHNDEVLLVAVAAPDDHSKVWTLPGGGVERFEDPLDTVVREVEEETGATSRVVQLLGVDSRVIPKDEAIRGVPHHNIGIFYEAAMRDSELRPEPSGDTATPTWVPFAQIASLPRSGLVDVGMSLFIERPQSGHVPPVQVEGLVRH